MQNIIFFLFCFSILEIWEYVKPNNSKQWIWGNRRPEIKKTLSTPTLSLASKILHIPVYLYPDHSTKKWMRTHTSMVFLLPYYSVVLTLWQSRPSLVHALHSQLRLKNDSKHLKFQNGVTYRDVQTWNGMTFVHFLTKEISLRIWIISLCLNNCM